MNRIMQFPSLLAGAARGFVASARSFARGAAVALAVTCACTAWARQYEVGTYDELVAALSENHTAQAYWYIANATQEIVLTDDIVVTEMIRFTGCRRVRIVGGGHVISVPTPGYDTLGVPNDSASDFIVLLCTTDSGTAGLTITDATLRGGRYECLVNYGSLDLIGCTIECSGSTEATAGGLSNKGTGKCHLSGCRIFRNAGRACGGFWNSVEGILVMEGCSVTENRCFMENGGGGRLSEKTLTVLNNCTFADNVSYSFGGGLFAGDGACVYALNTTFAGNGAMIGGGVYLTDAASFYAANSVFSGNWHTEGKPIEEFTDSWIALDFFIGDSVTLQLCACGMGVANRDCGGTVPYPYADGFAGLFDFWAMKPGSERFAASFQSPVLTTATNGTRVARTLNSMPKGVATYLTVPENAEDYDFKSILAGYDESGKPVSFNGPLSLSEDLVATFQDGSARTPSDVIPGPMMPAYAPYATIKTLTLANGTGVEVSGDGSLTGAGYPVGETVTVSATPDKGYDFTHWVTNGADAADLTDSTWSFVLTENMTVAPSGSLLPVEYLVPTYSTPDVPASGVAAWTTEVCSDYTIVTSCSKATTWGKENEDSWYVVWGENVSILGGVRCYGRVHLILVDGARLTVAKVGEGVAGIQTDAGGSFTVYGQSAGTGALVVRTDGYYGAGIGGANEDGCRDAANITINGGRVTASSAGEGAGIGGAAGGAGSNIVINDGIVTASADGVAASIGGGRAGAGSQIVINGGTVWAVAPEYATPKFGEVIGSGYEAKVASSGIVISPAARVFFDLAESKDLPTDFDGFLILTPQTLSASRTLVGGTGAFAGSALTLPLTNVATAAAMSLAVDAEKELFAEKLVSFSTNAASLVMNVADVPTPTAWFDKTTATLTFYCDEEKHDGDRYEVDLEMKGRSWPEGLGFTSVVFAPTFRYATVRNMNQWFSKETALTSVTGFRYVHCDRKSEVILMEMFVGCENLATIDLSGFSLKGSFDLTGMFVNCMSLTTIYVSEILDPKDAGWLSDGQGMFSGCKMLTGGAGSRYGSNFGDAASEAARVDGIDGHPGAFTLKDAATVSTWTQLHDALADESVSKVVLLVDVFCEPENEGDEILRPAGAKTLDLLGHSLYMSASSNGSFELAENADFTLADSVGGGAVYFCGVTYGVDVVANSAFTMTGGQMDGRYSLSAVVRVNGASAFTMTGGRIEEGCDCGVEVGNGGRFTMTGGELTSNHCGTRACVGTVTVGGTARITGNTSGNLVVESDATVVLSAETPLASGARIGVTTEVTPTVADPVVFATSASASDAQYFAADDSALYVRATDGELALRPIVEQQPGPDNGYTFVVAADAVAGATVSYGWQAYADRTATFVELYQSKAVSIKFEDSGKYDEKTGAIGVDSGFVEISVSDATVAFWANASYLTFESSNESLTVYEGSGLLLRDGTHYTYFFGVNHQNYVRFGISYGDGSGFTITDAVFHYRETEAVSGEEEATLRNPDPDRFYRCVASYVKDGKSALVVASDDVAAKHVHDSRMYVWPVANETDLVNLLLNGGSGYLTADIAPTQRLYVDNDLSCALCLNGHVITTGDGFNTGDTLLSVEDDATFAIVDCGTSARGFAIDEDGNWSRTEIEDADYVVHGGALVGGQAGTIIHVGVDSVLTVTGITFAGGGASSDEDGGKEAGGAVYGGNSREIAIHGGTFVGNRAVYIGGAVCARTGALTVDGDAVFTNNTATSGGAISVGDPLTDEPEDETARLSIGGNVRIVGNSDAAVAVFCARVALSGTPKIAGNNGDNLVLCEFSRAQQEQEKYKGDPRDWTAAIDSLELEDGADVGISARSVFAIGEIFALKQVMTADTPRHITTNLTLTAAAKDFFFPDRAADYVSLGDDGNLWLMNRIATQPALDNGYTYGLDETGYEDGGRAVAYQWYGLKADFAAITPSSERFVDNYSGHLQAVAAYDTSADTWTLDFASEALRTKNSAGLVAGISGLKAGEELRFTTTETTCLYVLNDSMLIASVSATSGAGGVYECSCTLPAGGTWYVIYGVLGSDEEEDWWKAAQEKGIKVVLSHLQTGMQSVDYANPLAGQTSPQFDATDITGDFAAVCAASFTADSGATTNLVLESDVAAGHSHAGTFFAPISSEEELEAFFKTGGRGYLTADVSLTGTMVVPAEAELCLAGHAIVQTEDNRDVLCIEKGATLDLRDCSGDLGCVTHETDTTGRGVYVSAGGTFNLRGGTVCGNAPSEDDGAGVALRGRFNMYGGVIRDNDSGEGSGGGICVYEDGDPAVANVYGGVVSNNTAALGGGVAVGGNAQFYLRGGTIARNRATALGGGGVVNLGTFTMTGGTIAGNEAGIAAGFANLGAATITGGEIVGNAASVFGGGGGNAYVDGYSQGWPSLTVGGTLVITNNVGYEGLADNLAVLSADGKVMSFSVSAERPLAEGAAIGVQLMTVDLKTMQPQERISGFIGDMTSGEEPSEEELARLASDHPRFRVTANGNALYLTANVQVTPHKVGNVTATVYQGEEVARSDAKGNFYVSTDSAYSTYIVYAAADGWYFRGGEKTATDWNVDLRYDPAAISDAPDAPIRMSHFHDDGEDPVGFEVAISTEAELRQFFTDGRGCGYLTADIAVTEPIVVTCDSGWDDHRLCLNGHTVVAAAENTEGAFAVASGQCFRLYDCGDGEHCFEKAGCWVPTDSKTAYVVRGGYVCGGAGCGIQVPANAAFALCGGTVVGSAQSGIDAQAGEVLLHGGAIVGNALGIFSNCATVEFANDIRVIDNIDADVCVCNIGQAAEEEGKKLKAKKKKQSSTFLFEDLTAGAAIGFAAAVTNGDALAFVPATSAETFSLGKSQYTDAAFPYLTASRPGQYLELVTSDATHRVYELVLHERFTEDPSAANEFTYVLDETGYDGVKGTVAYQWYPVTSADVAVTDETDRPTSIRTGGVNYPEQAVYDALAERWNPAGSLYAGVYVGTPANAGDRVTFVSTLTSFAVRNANGVLTYLEPKGRIGGGLYAYETVATAAGGLFLWFEPGMEPEVKSAERVAAETTAAGAQATASAAKATYDTAQAACDEAQDAVKQATEDKATAEEQIVKANAAIAGAESDKADADAALAKVQADGDAQIAAAQKKADATVQEAQNDVAKAQAALGSAQAHADNAAAAYASAQANYDEKSAACEKAKIDAAAAETAAKTKVAEAEETYKKTLEEIDAQLKSDTASLEKKMADLKEQYDAATTDEERAEIIAQIEKTKKSMEELNVQATADRATAEETYNQACAEAKQSVADAEEAMKSAQSDAEAAAAALKDADTTNQAAQSAVKEAQANCETAQENAQKVIQQAQEMVASVETQVKEAVETATAEKEEAYAAAEQTTAEAQAQITEAETAIKQAEETLKLYPQETLEGLAKAAVEAKTTYDAAADVAKDATAVASAMDVYVTDLVVTTMTPDRANPYAGQTAAKFDFSLEGAPREGTFACVATFTGIPGADPLPSDLQTFAKTSSAVDFHANGRDDGTFDLFDVAVADAADLEGLCTTGGSGFLTDDLTGVLPVTVRADVRLCLDGHRLDLAQAGATFFDGADGRVFSVCDCADAASRLVSDKAPWSGVVLEAPCTFTDEANPACLDTTGGYEAFDNGDSTWSAALAWHVSFDVAGYPTIAVKRGEKAVKPDDPTSPGFAFAGWYADEELKTAFDFGEPVAGDVTLYAKWVPGSAKVETPSGEMTPAVNFDDAYGKATTGGVVIVTGEEPSKTVDKELVVYAGENAKLDKIVADAAKDLVKTNSGENAVVVGKIVDGLVTVVRDGRADAQEAPCPAGVAEDDWTVVTALATDVTQTDIYEALAEKVKTNFVKRAVADVPGAEAVIVSVNLAVTPLDVAKDDSGDYVKYSYDAQPVATVVAMKNGETNVVAEGVELEAGSDFVKGAWFRITLPAANMMPVLVLHRLSDGAYDEYVKGEGLKPSATDDAKTFSHDAVAGTVSLWVQENSEFTVLAEEPAQVTLAYDAVGGAFADGADVLSVTMLEIDRYAFPTAPTREGYAFAGWYEGVTNGAPAVTEGTAIAATKLFAKWTLSKAAALPTGALTGGATADGLAATNVRPTAVLAASGKTDLPLPDMLEGRAIAEIGRNAFSPAVYDGAVTSVKLGAFVQYIRPFAFYRTAVTNVTFAVPHDYVTGEKTTLYVQDRAFQGANVKTLVFPAGGSYRLHQNAFSDNETIEDVYLYGDLDVTSWRLSPFRHVGEGLADGRKVTFHLNPSQAADAKYVKALTNGMDNACVMLATNVLGAVTYASQPVIGDTAITVEFTLPEDAPWKTVAEDTVYMLYSTDVSRVVVGTGNVAHPKTLVRQPGGSYVAEFEKPTATSLFFRVCVGK